MQRAIAYSFGLICLMLTILAGCAAGQTSASTAMRASLPTILTVTRQTSPLYHFAPFAPRTVQDTEKVQRMYRAILALPPAASHGYSCATGYGTVYHLHFLSGKQLVSNVTVQGDTCENVIIGLHDKRQLFYYNDVAFFSLFAQTLGVPLKAVYHITPAEARQASTP